MDDSGSVRATGPLGDDRSLTSPGPPETSGSPLIIPSSLPLRTPPRCTVLRAPMKKPVASERDHVQNVVVGHRATGSGRHQPAVMAWEVDRRVREVSDVVRIAVRQVPLVVRSMSIATLVVSAGYAVAAAGLRGIGRFGAVFDALSAKPTKARESAANATDAVSTRDRALALCPVGW